MTVHSPLEIPYHLFQLLTETKPGENVLMYLVMFFLAGWGYGKLTRNMHFLKWIFAIWFGMFAVAIVPNEPPLMIACFVFGMALSHWDRVQYFWYGMTGVTSNVYGFTTRKNRARQQASEAEMWEEIQNLKEELARLRRENAERDYWRDKHGQEESKQKSSSNSGSQKQKQQERQKRQQQNNRKRSSTRSKPNRSPEEVLHMITLGLDPAKNYTAGELKKAFNKMAKKTHPDVGGNEADFIRVQVAYEYLKGKWGYTF